MDALELAPSRSKLGQSPQVLLVESSQVTGLDLQDALKGAGFAPVGPFHSARQALLGIGDIRPDCAIVELVEGDEAVSLLRALRRAGIPFAVQSETALEGEFADAPRLAGPVWHGDILSVVRSLLDGARAA